MAAEKNPKKILLVEDDPHVLDILSEALGQTDYIVEKAASAGDAKQKLKSFRPHLVITDNDMPELTGLEMLRELRQEKNYVTVIFVSARTESQFVAETLRAGADDFIRKPFRIDELLARVEVVLRTNDLHHDLMEANHQLHDMVDHDYLTGLYNMRSMYDKIDIEIKRAVRAQRYMACVMLDMDNFKTVNDEHDHLFGSFVIKRMGEIINETMRETDFAARYGGDEFLIVLSETERSGVEKFCERLRKAVEETEFVQGNDRMKLTISLGYSVAGNEITADSRSLVRKADHNLYKSKEKGRNCFTGDES